jgi:hypothetical protein
MRQNMLLSSFADIFGEGTASASLPVVHSHPDHLSRSVQGIFDGPIQVVLTEHNISFHMIWRCWKMANKEVPEYILLPTTTVTPWIECRCQ